MVELNMLKAQIHPHFLFNTLNNLYSLTLDKSDKAAEVVAKLSDLLSFMLYEGNKPQVSIQQEITLLQNYIDLEKLRYGNQLNLVFEHQIEDTSAPIAPFLLLPLVENAFKHGDLSYPIDIQLDTKDERLIFKVKNRIKAKQKDQVGGIGLENIRKRLELIYEQQQTFNIRADEDIFEVELSIK